MARPRKNPEAPQASENVEQTENVETPVEDMETPSEATVEAQEPSTDDIAAELAKNEVAQQEVNTAPVAEMRPTQPLDLSMFTPEQIDALKAAIGMTEQTNATKRKKNPEITLREFGDDDFVVEIAKNAHRLEAFDQEIQKKRAQDHINVKTWKGKEVTMLLRDFYALPHHVFPAIRVLFEEKEVQKGEVMSAEHKVMVPNVIRSVETTFIIRMPDGSEYSLNGAYANR